MKRVIGAAVLSGSLAITFAVMADRSKLDIDGDGALSLSEIQVARPGLTAEQFALMDDNGDGVLTRDERPRGRKGRAKLDANDDGSIDLAEMQAARPDMTAERFAELDTNNDGLLTREERPRFKSMARKFAKLDVDGSGGLTFEEIQSSRKKKAAERFERMDVDGSGEVSLEEFEAQVKKRHRNGRKMKRGKRMDNETT